MATPAESASLGFSGTKRQKKVGFIGLGLIGGSIARSLKKFHPDIWIAAYTHTQETLEYAKSQQIIDEAFSQYDPRFGQCDYIFLCAPVSTNISYLSFLKDIISENTIITDVGSVKGEIHKMVTQLGLDKNFIGGHPMAGSEKTGVQNSTDYLIENAYYLITPGGEINVTQLSDFIDLIQSLGSIPMVLTYEEHDFITAAISHLPHIVASSLVNLVHDIDTPDQRMRMVAAGGFKDITRIASSSPDMWQPICMENREQISKVLDLYIRLLVKARCWIDEKEADDIYSLFANAREYRNSMPASSSKSGHAMYDFYCDIYDEAGGIATVATMLAMNNVSIKNIGIVHNREFGEGVLHIEFYEEEACATAEKVLTDRNYKIHKR